jgi:hypothetical protein
MHFSYSSLCPNNELPNFLASYKIPNLCDGFKCPQCRKLNCALHKHSIEPYKDVVIPTEIDKALTEVSLHFGECNSSQQEHFHTF